LLKPLAGAAEQLAQNRVPVRDFAPGFLGSCSPIPLRIFNL